MVKPQSGLLYKNKPKGLDCSWSAPPIMPVFRPHNGLTVVLFFEKEPTKKKYIKKETCFPDFLQAVFFSWSSPFLCCSDECFPYIYLSAELMYVFILCYTETAGKKTGMTGNSNIVRPSSFFKTGRYFGKATHAAGPYSRPVRYIRQKPQALLHILQPVRDSRRWA